MKLEQVIYTLQCGTRPTSYLSARRIGREITQVGEMQKTDCREFEFLLNGVSDAEVEIAKKMRQCGSFLGDFVDNTRGAMFQDCVKESGKGRRVIGGKQVQRYDIKGQKGFVAKSVSLDQNAYVQPGSILVQNIIAHIENPVDHIKITAARVSDKQSEEIVILDTVNQLANKSQISSYYFLGVLNSALINWYVYRFVYARAIRTMHFDRPATSRVPVPQVTAKNRDLYEQIVAAATRLSLVGSHEGLLLTDARVARSMRRTAECMPAIDVAVFELFGLSDAQVRSVTCAMSAVSHRERFESYEFDIRTKR